MFALRQGGAFSFFLRDILKFGFVLLHHYLFTQVLRMAVFVVVVVLFRFICLFFDF